MKGTRYREVPVAHPSADPSPLPFRARRRTFPLRISMRFGRHIALPLLGSVALTGCGTEGAGRILVDGSSSMFPVAEAVAEEFREIRPAVRVSVGISGSGGGFQRFCAGEIDIANASRPMDPSEAALCAGNGVSFSVIPLAWDGLSVVVNPEARFVECLTLQELARLWDAGSTVVRWSDLRPEWPDREISLYGPGTQSGTFDYFTEVVTGVRGSSRSDYQASEDDNVLVQGVAGDPDALGYFGYAYYAENPGILRLVAVDAGQGCVRPSERTIAQGAYSPLARLLYVYVRRAALERPEVRHYVTHMLEKAPELVPVTGYRALSEEQYRQSLGEVRNAAGGSS